MRVQAVSTSVIEASSRPRLALLHNNTLSPTLVFALGLFALSSFNYGFDIQAMSAAQAMTPFTKQFGHYVEKTHTWKLQPYFLSLLNSCHAAAQIFGMLVGSFISDRWGRRMCVFIMSLYALASSAVLVSSETKAQILTGRTIHYVYLGMELAVVPTALAEFSPPRYRGSMVGLYWLSVKVGGLVISCVTKRTSSIPTNMSWRIPFSLFFIVPAIVACSVWLIPESPRWSLSKGRREQAEASLRRIRRSDITDDEVAAEIEEMQYAIDQQPKNVKFMQIFSREHIKRTAIVATANFFQQVTGQAFSSQYGTLFVKSLKTLNAFSVNMGNNAINIGGILVCLALSDRIGRRPLIHISGFIQVGSLMAMGALGTVKNPSVTIRQGIVAMLLVFSFGYEVGWAPITYVVGTEVPTPSMRENTLRFGYTIKLIMEFTVSFTYPYLEDSEYAGLGSKLGFIYGSIAILAIVAGYFIIPETKNMALEEIDLQFREHIPVRKIGLATMKDTASHDEEHSESS